MSRDKREKTSKRNKRLTLGLLCENLVNEYNDTMWNGAQDAAWEHGANLVCFSGGMLRDPNRFCSQANILYDLVSEGNFDGLVVWGAQLVHHTTIEELETFCERYYPLPIVNIGLELSSVPSLLVDNYQGMYDIVTHLIEAHGYQRIAYIGGVGDTQEVRDRYRGYADALVEHEIPVDPVLVVSESELFDESCQKDSDCGRVGVRIFLDERKLRPGMDLEAVVSHDDGMGREALKELHSRGVNVPVDLALASFDDVQESRYLMPPLTTARQPFYDLGWQGIEMLLALLRGEEVPGQIVLPMHVMVRQSCGCENASVIAAGKRKGEQPERVVNQKKLLTALTGERGEVVTAMASQVGGSQDASRWAGRILDAFVAVFTAGTEKDANAAFIRVLEEVLLEVIEADHDVAAWHGAVSTMRRHLLPHLSEDTLSQAEDMWQQARVLIGEEARRGEAYQRLLAEQHTQILQDIGATLISTFDVGRMLDLLCKGLPRLGIPSAYLAVYENPQQYTYPQPVPEWSRLVLAYGDENPAQSRDASEPRKIFIDPDGQRFRSRQLVPPDLLPQERLYSLVVQPLFSMQNQIGFVLFETGPRKGTTYETLSTQISVALQGALLVIQEERRALQQKTAAEVSRAASSTLDLDVLIQQVVDLLKERFNLYYAGLFLVDEDGMWTGESNKWVVLQAGSGDAGRQMLAVGHKLEIGDGSMIGWCVANEQARIALDVGEDAQRFKNPFLPETRSELALPLVSRGDVIGALTIQSDRAMAFSDQDIAVLQTMADQLANAIVNARLFEKTQAALSEVEATQRRYLQRAWDDYTQVQEANGYQLSEASVEPLGAELLPEVQKALQEQRTLILDRDDGTSVLVVPVLLRGQPLGALGFKADRRSEEWSVENIVLVEGIGEQFALAAENLRLLDETQRRAARERLTRDITDKMRRAASIEDVVQTAVDELFSALGSSRAFVRLGVGQSPPDDGSEGA
jgi:DNA-binding LacI/PurR family transcriptional regulator/GAF domain-containing protein